jgi:dolichol kinase
MLTVSKPLLVLGFSQVYYRCDRSISSIRSGWRMAVADWNGSNINLLLRGSSLVCLVVVFQVAAARLNLDREAKRRFQHAITGHALVQISHYLPVPLCIAVLSVACAGIWYIRMYQSEVYFQLFVPLLRPHELDSDEGRPKVLPGAFYFLLGTTMSAVLFPMPIARYAVECLSLADPMAAWVGQSISSPKLLPRWTQSSASLAGSTACFATAWCIGYIMLLYWVDDDDDDDDRAPVSIPCLTVAALACCIAEAMPMVNDNLSIPLVTALSVQWARSWM